MRHRDSNCGITGESFKEMQSRDIGHAHGIGNVQTNALQTSATDYEESSTKPCIEAEDWLADKVQPESRMPKNIAEAASDIKFEEPISKTRSSTRVADSSSDICNNSVASGMQIPMCLQLPNRTMKMLQSAMRNPPVTVSTLGELNLTWMMHYVNLRCDINFDHDLHFTPIKGPRGEEKRRQALNYWLALEAEFKIYQHPSQKCKACELFGTNTLVKFQPRLSTMFQDLKDLLETLVPDKDHDQVATNLDIDLITQQVEKGVLDVGKLSRWLAKLLKSHCAPMRDESAEAMAEKLEYGANNGDLSILINGLESLFGFLEAMKLDVANHQIRTFRYILIEETVAFQQNHFRKRIDDGRLNLAAAESWYKQVYDRHQENNILLKDYETFCFEAFLGGLVGLCTSSPNEQQIPVTLHYDQGRVQQLRADVQDFVILRLCTDVFKELVSKLGCRNQVPDLDLANVQSRLLTIADDEAGNSEFVPWNEKSAEIATEITRAAFAVYSYPHSPRIPADEFDCTQARLLYFFTHRYEEAEAQMLSELAEKTVQHAAVFQKMSIKDISEAQKQYQQNRQARGDLSLPDPENMARMLAHMGVIHWQVWRDLAYLRDADGSGLETDKIPPEQGSNKALDQEEKNMSGSIISEEDCVKASIDKPLGRACE
jgi:hypothetical protein